MWHFRKSYTSQSHIAILEKKYTKPRNVLFYCLRDLDPYKTTPAQAQNVFDGPFERNKHEKMYLLGQKIHTAPVNVLTFLCWTSNCSTVSQRSSSSKAGTTITYYLGSFPSVSQFEGYFQSKNDATTVVAPAKNVILPWTFRRYLRITSAKLRDLIWSSFYQKSTLAKNLMVLWNDHATTRKICAFVSVLR